MMVEKREWKLLIGGFVVVLIIGGAVVFVIEKQKAKTISTNKKDSFGKSASSGKSNSGSMGAQLKIEATTDPWDRNYWQDMSRQIGGKVRILTKASADKLAAQIYNAKGVLNDDEEAVYKAIGALKSKVQFSYLASVFYDNYKVDMQDYLKDFLSEGDEFPKVNAIVTGLPAYT